MKILTISDQVVERIYSASVRETYPDVGVIIGCGDLPYEYLEFLVTLYNIPMLYVPGNHDPEHGPRPASRAEGGINLDGKVVFVKDFLMAGLGGSILYQPGSPNQYTQVEMYLKVFSLLPKIWINQWGYRRRLDIFIAHSPPFGIHDDDDPPHQGFKALNFLIDVVKPRYFLHGHTMFYRQNLKSHITRHAETEIVNVYPFRVMEL